MERYRILNDGRAIHCNTCKTISHNPNDVRERYCAKCHTFHLDEHMREMASRQSDLFLDADDEANREREHHQRGYPD